MTALTKKIWQKCFYVISEAKPYKCHTFLLYFPGLLILGTHYCAVNNPVKSMEILQERIWGLKPHSTNSAPSWQPVLDLSAFIGKPSWKWVSRWCHMEQRQAVLSEPWTNCTFVGKISGGCFNPLFGVVCHTVIDNSNISSKSVL